MIFLCFKLFPTIAGKFLLSLYTNHENLIPDSQKYRINPIQKPQVLKRHKRVNIHIFANTLNEAWKILLFHLSVFFLYLFIIVFSLKNQQIFLEVHLIWWHLFCQVIFKTKKWCLYLSLIAAAMAMNACSTFVASLALVSKNGMPISSANACTRNTT